MKKRVIVMSEGIEFPASNRDLCVEVIMEEYHRYDNSMCDILASLSIEGYSVEDVAYIYAKCMKLSDSDRTIRFSAPLDDKFSDVVKKYSGMELCD